MCRGEEKLEVNSMNAHITSDEASIEFSTIVTTVTLQGQKMYFSPQTIIGYVTCKC
jgi:hypothetical protein